MSECQHENKEYADFVLTSNPPQYPWICKDCGEEGIEVGRSLATGGYEREKKKWGKYEQI